MSQGQDELFPQNETPTGSGGDAQAPRQRDPRAVTMLFSGALTLVLALLAVIIPTPYVIESPGPTINTLDSVSGNPVISIEGAPSYRPSGALDMVTVYVNGGPQSDVSVVDVISAWANPDQAIFPVELVYPPDATREEVESENKTDMVNSQDLASAAALNLLNINYTSTLTVTSVEGGSGSDGVLQIGDQIQSIGGVPARNITDIQRAITQAGGGPVEVSVLRAGAEVNAQVTPQRDQEGRYLLGVFLQNSFQFPFQINFNLANVGGPSAGMMFALGAVDLLTPGDLTGGKHIAGTGSIDASGSVGPIGGVVQKMVSAKNENVDLFIAPAANCGEVVGNEPEGLTVVSVENLEQAYTAVKTVASGGDTSALPRCPAA